ncbi:MAG TPA: acylneuraminate cytidylyltransferase family protein, partial [bacterium]|nr:acylneuraminate cytidylyltransferase family protein [bacterium]HOL35526.1 acylneuraminate cytidylyltransferase family protein [bacterium]
VAIIPARGGSKGIPKKNIRPLLGYPLIAYSIAAAHLSKKIERVILSTDSEEIAEIARYYGAEVPFLRPREFARDNSPDIEFIIHVIIWFKKNENNIPRYLVLLRPTTPLRMPDIVDAAIIEIMKKKEATSLRSGHAASESPFKWFVRDADGYFRGMVPGYTNDELNMPRQSFPTVYIPDGYVDVVKPEFIIENDVMYGDKMVGFVTPFCHEVDSPEDFDFLEFELKKNGHVLLDYLKTSFPGGKK